MKQTKIVASISDRRCDVDFIRHLFDAGMNVVRMNTAHADEEGIKNIIKNVRAVSRHIGILIDTKGPEVRTTGCAEPIVYKDGDVVKIFGRPEMDSTHDIINLSYSNFAADVREGCHILFDDGALDMEVIGINGPAVIAKVKNDGVLGAHKSVNVPGVHIALPTLTEKDRKNIMLAINQDIDFIAHSFVRSAADVRAVQAILDAFNSDIKIISKIENQEGVDNIDEIIEASYGIMIARGDLGIEVPIERIPGIQRQIIHKCIMAKKPVIVATQMLHTMINNPRPTRAEVTDIANAIYSHTDALMLSGETASGKYPDDGLGVVVTVCDHLLKHIGAHALEPERAIIGADEEVVADILHLFSVDKQVLGLGSDDDIHGHSMLLEPFGLGIHGGCAESARYEDVALLSELFRAHLDEFGRLSERTHNVGKTLSRFVSDDVCGRSADPLSHDCDRAFFAIEIADGQRYAFSSLVSPDDEEFSGLGRGRKPRRRHLHPADEGCQHFFCQNFKHCCICWLF